MLTANEIELVRASFAQVVLIQNTAADLFYDRLFAIAPNLRRLFPVDMREQKRKLIQRCAFCGIDYMKKLNYEACCINSF